MSICESGVDCNISARKISIDVIANHPLMKLCQSLPWRELLFIANELVEIDFNKKWCILIRTGHFSKTEHYTTKKIDFY